MPCRLRILLLSLSLGVCASIGANAAVPPLSAPNMVAISPRLVTSGQPSAAMLSTLAEQGFEADIYLAPSTVPDAVADEEAIVRRQGLVYVNIPIRFNQPTTQDFDAFVTALAPLRERRVLVHCQVNLRASSMVFLYRVIVGKEDAQSAYESVTKVWSPDGPWRRFIVAMLQKNHVAFEPY